MMKDFSDVKDVYEEVYTHLLACSDVLYKAGFENALLYRSIKCLLHFIGDML